jgi:NADPH:quinone reductase-like Zn-dependent oxidoreductase
MKALVQEGSGSADVLHLRDVAVPTVAEDRVLVRVHGASVNAADWHAVHSGGMVRVITAMLGGSLPPIRGSDLAGVVEAIGGKVTRFKPGDEVFGTGAGSFAEFAAAKESTLAPKPAQLSFEEAAALPVAGIAALQGLRDMGRLQPAEHVLVYGAGGGVGSFAVQIAAALGGQVTAATGANNLETVRSFAPGPVLDYSKVDVTRSPERYDIIFDIAAIEPLRDLLRILRPGGRFVLTGAAKGGMLAIMGRLGAVQIRRRLLRQHAVSFLARITAEDLLALKALVDAGKLRPIVDRRYELREAAEAVRYLGTGAARAKVVISVG